MRNRISTFIGTLASVLTSRVTAGGTLVVEGTIAGEHNKLRADGTGEIIAIPFYQPFSVLGTAAENLLRQGYQKGDVLMIMGEPDYSEWKNDVGAPRSTVNLKALQVEKLSGAFESTTDRGDFVRMTGGMNQTTLIGNLCADVELRYTPGGDAVANMRLGVNEVWTVRGVKQQKAHYFNVTAWREKAEAVAGLKKGDSVTVTGPLLRESWESPEGEKQSRRYVEAETVIPLARRVVKAESAAPAATAARTPAAAPAATESTVSGPIPSDGQFDFSALADVPAPDFEPAF